MPPPKPSSYLALLRGINVGGKNLLPMPSLAAIFTAIGCAAVQTYIQSGNILFTATPACALRVAELVPQAVSERFGFRPVILLRTAVEIAQVAASNPFLPTADSPSDPLHVAFLADAPTLAQIQSLDPHRSPGDSFQVRGREIYLHLPQGVGKSKLTNAYFDSKLATTSTLRNWRTVLKLCAMTQALTPESK
jgi:uncharacterized protein (DUF1697 family)